MIKTDENSKHYVWGDNCDGWHLVNSKSLSIIKERVPSGVSEMRHSHRNAEQFFYILKGTATIEIDGKNNLVSEGEGIHVPAGIPHQFRNLSDKDVIFIVTSSPPSHGDRIEIKV
jgi:mannose-6-phosphate isomerase-like protein (cupin superfamily)